MTFFVLIAKTIDDVRGSCSAYHMLTFKMTILCSINFQWRLIFLRRYFTDIDKRHDLCSGFQPKGLKIQYRASVYSLATLKNKMKKEHIKTYMRNFTCLTTTAFSTTFFTGPYGTLMHRIAIQTLPFCSKELELRSSKTSVTNKRTRITVIQTILTSIW